MTDKVYKFKDEIDELSEEDLISLENVISNKIINSSRIQQSKIISGSSINLGKATAYMVGNGFWVADEAGTYKLHLGDPAGYYLSFDGTYLTLKTLFTDPIAFYTSSASDTLRKSNDAAKTITATSYTKSKEIKMGCKLDGCRVKFTLEHSDAGSDETTYGKIYKNGVAIGTERSESASTATEFSEDFTGIALHDLIQVYCYNSVTSNAWTYEQKFNSLTDGDLNGQDSWSGSTSFDVQTTVKYEGAKAISCATGAGATISRSITGISSGTVYIAIRTTIVQNEQALIYLNEGVNNRMIIKFAAGGKIQAYNNAAYIDVANYGVNTWYVIKIQFDDAAQPDKFRVKAYNGAVWSAWTAWLTVNGATYASIDGISLAVGGASAAGEVSYFDTITLTNPITYTGELTNFRIYYDLALTDPDNHSNTLT